MSAEPSRSGLELRAADFDGPDAQRLVAAIQADMVLRYGSPDSTELDASMFRPPAGLFLLARSGGAAVACAGFRRRDERVAELKRMYVEPAARARGIARRLLAALEAAAAEVGYRELWLETGVMQPEAIALYESVGYRPVPRFGTCACQPDSRHYGKPLLAVPRRS